MIRISTPNSSLFNLLESETDLLISHCSDLEALKDFLEVNGLTENTLLVSPSDTSINIIMEYAQKEKTIHLKA